MALFTLPADASEELAAEFRSEVEKMKTAVRAAYGEDDEVWSLLNEALSSDPDFRRVSNYVSTASDRAARRVTAQEGVNDFETWLRDAVHRVPDNQEL